MSERIAHIGRIKFSSKENASGKVFFRMPLVTTISKMTAQDYFEIGNRKSHSGRHKEAIKNFKKALELRPPDYMTMLKMGHAHRETGDAAKARECFREAARLIPDTRTANWLGEPCGLSDIVGGQKHEPTPAEVQQLLNG